MATGLQRREFNAGRRVAVACWYWSALKKFPMVVALLYGDCVCQCFLEVVGRRCGCRGREVNGEFVDQWVVSRDCVVGEVVGSPGDGGSEFGIGALPPAVQGRSGFGSGDFGFDGLCSFA